MAASSYSIDQQRVPKWVLKEEAQISQITLMLEEFLRRRRIEESYATHSQLCKTDLVTARKMTRTVNFAAGPTAIFEILL